MSKPPTGIVMIRGKEYLTVAKRVQMFREAHPTWSIVTSIVDRNADFVLMHAAIHDDTGRLLATGHAEEWRKSSEINRTSAIENSETSAIGRALAALGFGGSEFASADEIEIAKRKEQVESPLPAPITAAQTAQDEFDRLPDDAKTVVREAALEIIALCQEGNMAGVNQIIDEMFQAHEDRLSLWSQLPSNVRSAIKKYRAALPQQPQEAA